MKRKIFAILFAIGTLMLSPGASAAGKSYYLIGNSLTWGTVPPQA
ncbi:MAG: hypothetical protein ACPGVU_17415 [Limisphaerales bacterium]